MFRPVKKETQAHNVFESILNELDNLDTSRKKEPAKAHSRGICVLQKPKPYLTVSDSHNSDPDDLAPGTSKQLMPSTPTPNSNTRPLTRLELSRCDPDELLMKRFLEKPGFMERLLGYKMLKGRVDSHIVMRSHIRLDDSMFFEEPEVSSVTPTPCISESFSSTTT